MTREEMVKKVKSKMCKDCGIYLGGGKCSDNCSVTEIIKALEQEPSGDLISRQAVLEIHSKYAEYMGATKFWQMRDNIKALPSVKGHWIEKAEEYYKAINEKGGGVNENTPYFTDDIACSECLAKFSVIDNETERFICCPNCGARMERNDKE